MKTWDVTSSARTTGAIYAVDAGFVVEHVDKLLGDPSLHRILIVPTPDELVP